LELRSSAFYGVANTASWLQGGVYPNGEATSYYWQYGTTSSYGSRSKALSAGSGTAAVPAATHLTDLKPGTQYHYLLVATNTSGTEYGYDGSFTTTGHARVASKRRRADHGHRRAAIV
jgi:hypothetical protein